MSDRLDPTTDHPEFSVGEPPKNQAITRRECDAMRLLHADNPDRWSYRVLRMVFELSTTESVRYHVTEGCAHANRVNAVGFTEAQMEEYERG